METTEYLAPKIEVVDMEFEGNVCQKTSVEFSDQENANGWDD